MPSCDNKVCPEDKVCNPASGRCVLRNGRIGKSIGRPQSQPQSQRPAARVARAAAAVPRAAASRAAAARAAAPKNNTQDRCANKVCPEDKVCNPASGRCVLKNGRVGKSIRRDNRRNNNNSRRAPPAPPAPPVRVNNSRAQPQPPPQPQPRVSPRNEAASKIQGAWRRYARGYQHDPQGWPVRDGISYAHIPRVHAYRQRPEYDWQNARSLVQWFDLRRQQGRSTDVDPMMRPLSSADRREIRRKAQWPRLTQAELEAERRAQRQREREAARQHDLQAVAAAVRANEEQRQREREAAARAIEERAQRREAARQHDRQAVAAAVRANEEQRQREAAARAIEERARAAARR